MPRSEAGLHYELLGRAGAPVLVLLRGLARSLRHWLELPTLLAPSFHVVLVDNRGIGRSPPAPLSLGIADMADDVAHALDRARIERCHLFGMSLGGMIAQRFALRHPDRLDRLVIGCSTPGGRHARRPALRTLGRMLHAATRPRPEALQRSAEITLSAEFLRRHPEVVARWVSIDVAAPLSRRTVLAQALAAARHDSWDELPTVRAPTLVVCGDADGLIPPDNSRLLAERIPGATLVWLPGAGHDFATELPERTAELLRSFLLPAER
ncbi:MAG: alpha/beta fold hydrolase [Polyangiaceae bacterium]|nr:alpha/beta fold hydrolase [Polyangiaceae bacterium]